jgi:hypothetical protein
MFPSGVVPASRVQKRRPVPPVSLLKILVKIDIVTPSMGELDRCATNDHESTKSRKGTKGEYGRRLLAPNHFPEVHVGRRSGETKWFHAKAQRRKETGAAREKVVGHRIQLAPNPPDPATSLG